MNKNYTFLLNQVEKYDTKKKSKVLDFGCGDGSVVSLFQENGFDVYGADTFEGIYEGWFNIAKQKAGETKILKIKNGSVPVTDNFFDVVLSNQVFEHIESPDATIKEIHRILKPEGKLLCLFPLKQTLFEQHVKLYFAHYFRHNQNLQFAYLYIFALLGIGNFDRTLSIKSRVTHAQIILKDHCFYHDWRKFRTNIETLFDNSQVDLASDNFQHRLPVLKSISTYLSKFGVEPILHSILRKFFFYRAGVCFSIIKSK